MIELDSNHCQIVKDSISGKRAVDEQTFASLTILGERLKRLDNIFEGVEFSPAVERLKKQRKAVAIS